MSISSKKRAKEIVEGLDFDVAPDSAAPKEPRADIQSVPTLTASAQVYTPSDTKIHGLPDEDLARDRSQMNRDPNTLNKVGQAL
jgi:hypothetical protein